MYDQLFQEEMTVVINDWLKELNVPGVVIALVRDGRLAQTRCFGITNKDTEEMVTADTIFEAASLSKPVVAYAALQLVDKGLLDLDRPLVSYMPDGRIPVTLPDVISPSPFPPLDLPLLEAVTCRYVLSHTTGLPNWPPLGSELAIRFPPGSRFSYSGMAYSMVQTIIEQLSGQPCEDYIQANIFEPFGMTRSTFIWDGENKWPLAVGHDEAGKPVEKWLWRQMIAGAGLHCSTVDYGRFLATILQPAADSGFHISAKLWQEMVRPQVQVNDSAYWHEDWPKADYVLDPNVGWGLGWGTQLANSDSAIWHWGDNGSFKSFVIAQPDSGSGLVIMTNSQNGDKLYERLLVELTSEPYPALDWLNSL